MEVIFSEKHGEHWSLILRVVEEEWLNIELPTKDELLECILHMEFYEE